MPGDGRRWLPRILGGATRRRVIGVVLGAVLFVGFGWVLLGPLAGQMAQVPDELASLRSDWIGYLALGAVGVALLNWHLATRQRTSDAYVTGLELLGAESATRRVAGVYALERIMRDESRYHAEVVDILAAFVRESARDPDYRSGLQKRSGGKVRPEQDLQAALTVLGRRPRGRDEHDDIRLSDAYLEGANLRHGQFQGARLRRAVLTDASLENVCLRKAKLRDADLTKANLSGADLNEAELTGAHLSGTVGSNVTATQLAAAHCRPDQKCAKAPDQDLGGVAQRGG